MKDKKVFVVESKGCFGLLGCLSIFFIIIALVCAVIYAGLLSFFGFEYDSISSIIQFIIILVISMGILEGVFFIFRIALTMIGLTMQQAKMIGMALELVGVIWIVQMIDDWMTSISIPTTTAFFFAICLFLLELALKSSSRK